MPIFLAQPSTLFYLFFPPLIFRGGLVLLHILAAAPALAPTAAMPNREGRARGTGVRAVQWSP